VYGLKISEKLTNADSWQPDPGVERPAVPSSTACRRLDWAVFVRSIDERAAHA